MIQVHREELTQKQEYWDNALACLSKRNKELLKEKKLLCLQNKDRVDKLVVEKVDL